MFVWGKGGKENLCVENRMKKKETMGCDLAPSWEGGKSAGERHTFLGAKKCETWYMGWSVGCH